MTSGSLTGYSCSAPDPYGEALAYEDVFTKLEHATRHYEAVGLGKEHVKRIVR
jgi:2,4'-dihydroxyacetophenone dioxygenase